MIQKPEDDLIEIADVPIIESFLQEDTLSKVEAKEKVTPILPDRESSNLNENVDGRMWKSC